MKIQRGGGEPSGYRSAIFRTPLQDPLCLGGEFRLAREQFSNHFDPAAGNLQVALPDRYLQGGQGWLAGCHQASRGSLPASEVRRAELADPAGDRRGIRLKFARPRGAGHEDSHEHRHGHAGIAGHRNLRRSCRI
jgi:hypothetical protein